MTWKLLITKSFGRKEFLDEILIKILFSKCAKLFAEQQTKNAILAAWEVKN
jgi:hypothetical protein